MEKAYYKDKNKWQDSVGYSRAIKIGKHIFISGTVANDDEGNALHIGQAGKQTKEILNKFENILSYFGSDLTKIVRTRIYTTDISKWEEIGEVHGKYFSKIQPVTTMVEVSKLISQDYMVEIEAEAIVEN